jgi:hypothetical protein
MKELAPLPLLLSSFHTSSALPLKGRLVPVISFTVLPLTAFIPPAVRTLGPVEVKRVVAGPVALPHAGQHARHFLGMDRQDEATIGARL